MKPLTNPAQGPFCGIVALGRGSTEQVQTSEGQCSPIWLKQVMFVSILLYGTQAMLSKTKKYMAYDQFHGNSLWQYSDQERASKHAWIYMYLKTTVPCYTMIFIQ